MTRSAVTPPVAAGPSAHAAPRPAPVLAPGEPTDPTQVDTPARALRGIIVPEDFEVPEGYVRHYQVTDDGHALPAILMFDPDYEWVDANGQPIALPENRVVPPELAPVGLRIEILALPEAPGSRR